jgi:hypothetical protein
MIYEGVKWAKLGKVVWARSREVNDDVDAIGDLR